MSGAEAIVVLGLISSTISIVGGIKKVYEAAKSAHGLPKAFCEVAGRLPIVGNILSLAEQNIHNGNVDEDSCQGVKQVAKACEEKAKKLDELFHKAISPDGASDLKRYYKAVKACGKSSEVERLMKRILEDVQLLTCEHGMKIATKIQQDQIAQAITEVSAQNVDDPVLHRQDTPPPPPSSTVPFRQDPDFIIREALLEQLHSKCAMPAARIALDGLGGFGKVPARY